MGAAYYNIQHTNLSLFNRVLVTATNYEANLWITFVLLRGNNHFFFDLG